MRVPDEIKDCVGFLCCRKNDGSLYYGGTAFFVAVPCEDDPQDFQPYYLVTAKHCLERSQWPLLLRLNTKGSGAQCFPLPPKDDWFMGEDGNDVAIIRYIPTDQTTCKPIPSDMLMTSTLRKDLDVGIGDDLFLTGLFPYHHGKQRNIPVWRSGSIAAMPEESLEDEATGMPYQAYLAELRSLGGLSGSPVFIPIQIGSATGRQYSDTTQRLYHFYLLGLIRGHWDINRERNIADFGNDAEQVHMGMAIITPIEELSLLLYGDEAVQERQHANRARKNGQAPTQGFGSFVSAAYSPLRQP